ncbi:MAG: DUF916 domain-containing protein [bacterium]|nr:DUF916 domain-containing protein [bacterium]
MKKVLKFIFLSIILLFTTLIIGLFASVSHAQNQLSTQQSLEVSPPTQEIQVDPGKTTTVKAKVRNRSNKSLSIKVRIEDFTASGEEGQVKLEEKNADSLSNWVSLTSDSFIVKPGESKEVVADIHAPQTIAGGHYGSFVFSYGSPSKEIGTVASVTQELASLFLIRVSGPINENLSLVEFTAPKFSEFGPIPFSMKFTNKGNIHVKTYGLINIVNMFGKNPINIVVSGTNVFPGANRIAKAELNKRFLLGNYTATAVIYYGTGVNHTLTATTTFFVFPVRIFVFIAIIILILYILYKRLSKTSKT